MPKNGMVDVPAWAAAARARVATYGPRNTVPTVVLKALLAQSYMAQPRVSRLSLTNPGAATAVAPPAARAPRRCFGLRRVLSFGPYEPRHRLLHHLARVPRRQAASRDPGFDPTARLSARTIRGRRRRARRHLVLRCLDFSAPRPGGHGESVGRLECRLRRGPGIVAGVRR